MATIEDVRAFVSELPRAYEVIVRDRVKFRVGRIVFLAFSRDEAQMGFGYPKELREALVASDPSKFLMPGKADMRYQWAEVRLPAIDVAELRELVLDAWRMCVPKRIVTELEERWGSWRALLEIPPGRAMPAGSPDAAPRGSRRPSPRSERA